MKKLINKLNQRLRSSLSIMVLSLCTVFLFLSNSAMAQTTPTFSGGTGTQTAPYLISTPANLTEMANYVNGTNGYTQNSFSGKYFQMTNDIDMSSVSNFTPIGIGPTNGTSFQGIFDGNNKKVLNLKEDGTGIVGGLFGLIYNNATVKNLGIISADIRLENTGTDLSIIGAIAGGVNGSNIINCYVRNSQIKANCRMSGGLAGIIYNGTHIYNCYTTGTTVELQGNNTYVGGLIGWCYAGSNIVQNCYSTSVLSSTTTNNTITYIGGIYGYVYSTNTIKNCYYRTDWKGTNLTGTITENSTYNSNSSTIYSKATTDMQASSFVSSTGGAGTTLNLASTVVSGATTYQTDYSTPFQLNDGYPIFTTQIAQIISGSGTQAAPFLISTPDDLIKLANYVNGTNGYTQNGFSGKYFQVTNDIDMSSVSNFTQIGIGTTTTLTFQGIFDGDNKAISNLREDNTGITSGLFGSIKNATVKNLGIISADIRLENTGTDLSAIGVITGVANGSNLINCYVRNSQIKANCRMSGGLAGIIHNGAHIYNCYITGTTVELQGNNTYVGGLIGWGYSGSNIVQNCYSTSLLSSTTTNNTITDIGGIYGHVYSTNTIKNCYYRTDWKGTNLTGTITENSTYNSNSSTIYSKATTDMQASSFVSSTETAGTTLNLPSTVVSGAITYKADYAFVINHGFPIFTTEQMISPYIIKNGEKIVVPSGTAITDIPSVIIIKDGGQLLNNSTNALNNVTVEKTLKVGAWNLIGSALKNNDISVLNSNVGVTSGLQHDMSALAYDYTTNRWSTTYLGVNTGFDNQFALGDSYMVWPLTTNTSGTAITPSDNYITVSQTSSATKPLLLNTSTYAASPMHNVNASLTYNGGIWGAFSNPYTANVTTSAFLGNNYNGVAVQGGAIYFWDADNNAWITNLSTNNKYTLQADGTYTTTTGTPKTIIKPAEGFMIAETNNAISAFSNKIFVTIPKPTTAKSSIKTNNDLITFATIANNTTKEAFARINEQASNDFDQNDAFVMFSNNSENLVEPYFASNNKMLLKDEFKTLPYVAPINFHASKVSNTDLTVNNIPENVNVSIIDLSNGNENALTNGSAYSFVANEGENEGRFVVKFAKNNVSIDNNAEENNISLAMYPNPATSQTTLFVDGLTNNAQVSICDVQGRTINTYTINKNQSTLKINTENLSSGVYYIRVVSNNLTKTEKLVVK